MRWGRSPAEVPSHCLLIESGMPRCRDKVIKLEASERSLTVGFALRDIFGRRDFFHRFRNCSGKAFERNFNFSARECLRPETPEAAGFFEGKRLSLQVSSMCLRLEESSCHRLLGDCRAIPPKASQRPSVPGAWPNKCGLTRLAPAGGPSSTCTSKCGRVWGDTRELLTSTGFEAASLDIRQCLPLTGWVAGGFRVFVGN